MYEALLVCTMILNVIVDFIDRRTVVHSDLFALSLWMTIVQLLLVLPLIGLVDRIPLYAMGLCALVGAFSAFGRILWYHALETHRQTLSRLTPFVRLSSVISLLCAYLVLGEPFNYWKAGGGVLMILGSLVVMMDNPVGNLKSFIEDNRAAGLALIFAASTASIAVMYKYLLSQPGIHLFSMYFFLKLFQLLPVLIVSLNGDTLIMSYRKIRSLKLLVVGRVLQTVAALIYLFALSGLDLSVVEPIAALTPFLVLGIELMQRHWSRARTAEPMSGRAVATRMASLVIVSFGIFVFTRGKA